MTRKSFCGGVLCKKRDRKFVCIECKTNICTLCSVNVKKIYYCIDCFVKYYLPTLAQNNYYYYDFIYDTDKKPSLC